MLNYLFFLCDFERHRDYCVYQFVNMEAAEKKEVSQHFCDPQLPSDVVINTFSVDKDKRARQLQVIDSGPPESCALSLSADLSPFAR